MDMPLPLIGAIVGPIVSAIGSIAGSWLETRKVKAEGAIAIAKSRIDFKVAQYTARAQMDVEAMKGMAFSWKDEYLLLLFSIPLILCFIPVSVPWVTAGFAVLHTLPLWYQWAITGMVAATFGLRTWKGIFK
jgi:hypothetical protein